MAAHSSVLAWRIPGTGEPGGLPSMGSHRFGHDWSDLAAAAARILILGFPYWNTHQLYTLPITPTPPLIPYFPPIPRMCWSWSVIETIVAMIASASGPQSTFPDPSSTLFPQCFHRLYVRISASSPPLLDPPHAVTTSLFQERSWLATIYPSRTQISRWLLFAVSPISPDKECLRVKDMLGGGRETNQFCQLLVV